MARILSVFPSALIAAREGLSANAFDRQLRELGMGARRSEVLQLYKIAVSIVAKSPEEPFRNIREAPRPEQLEPYPTKKATGIIQHITLTYRDTITGHISRTFYSTTSPQGIPREQAMAQAITAYSDSVSGQNQEFIGAVHTSAYNLTPFEG